MFFWVLFLSAALVWMATAAEARRVALVVGQNAYRELLPLYNPVTDSRRMGYPWRGLLRCIAAT